MILRRPHIIALIIAIAAIVFLLAVPKKEAPTVREEVVPPLASGSEEASDESAPAAEYQAEPRMRGPSTTTCTVSDAPCEFVEPDSGLVLRLGSGESARTEIEFDGFDTGFLRNVSVWREGDVQGGYVSILSYHATSNDFSLGVGEGCCYFYVGQPLVLDDLSAAVKAVEAQLGPIFGPRIATIGGERALLFHYVTAYAGASLHRAAIVPLTDAGVFTNALFRSPPVLMSDIQTSESDEEFMRRVGDHFARGTIFAAEDSGVAERFAADVAAVTWR